jgi:hypothetical protein
MSEMYWKRDGIMKNSDSKYWYLIVFILGICIVAYSQKSDAPARHAGTPASQWVTDMWIEGMGFFLHGNYEKAIGCFNTVIEQNPRDSQAYFDRRLAYIKLGAAREFSKTPLLYPGNYTIRTHPGIAFADSNLSAAHHVR